MTKTEAARLAYRMLLTFSGESPEVFARACRGLVMETRDGEGYGPPSAEEWVSAAREHAWMTTTECGRNKLAEKRFAAHLAKVDRVIACWTKAA